jgi:hypothetical protein
MALVNEELMLSSVPEVGSEQYVTITEYEE